MPKKAISPKTPARIMWAIIAAEMQLQCITQKALAKRIGKSESLVSDDARDPDRIPQWRLWLYFAVLGIDAETVLRPVLDAHKENMLKKE